ncbi:MAG TPA: CRTAC1 family protein [Gemmataceae bacterium]|nr:CRTAC1 family protein [Gemmataceae bacterium]
MKNSPLVLVVGAVVGIAVAGLIVFFIVRNYDQKPDTKPALTGKELFKESADESGIKFMMQYLPGEQGEKFKINLYDHGCGVAVGDFDGDGFDDIYLVNQLGPNMLLRNKGDGTFDDKTAEAGVALGDRICVSATFVDYDNDGRQDLFVTSTRGGNVLFHNEGNGKFRDVTAEVGLDHKGHSQSAHFVDFNNDGHLDLLVTQTAEWTLSAQEPKLGYHIGKSTYFETAGSKKEFNILYRNDGKGKFTVVPESGLEGLGWASDACPFDYDGDGLMDVVVSNMFGRAQLYKNLGNFKFKEVTKEVLGKTPWGGMGANVFDSGNKGLLDLYIVDMHSDMWLPSPDYDLSTIDPKKKNPYLGVPFDERDPRYAQGVEAGRRFHDLVQMKTDEVVFGNTFHKNLGGGKFVEMSGPTNLENFWPWGIAAGDFNNDGLVDLFITGGMGYPFNYWPNLLMMNDGKENFVDRAKELGIEPPSKGINLPDKIGGKDAPRSSRSAAIADFSHNGRLDLIVNNFNDHPYYFKNIGKGGHYLELKLTGTKSNRDAIGAVARLYVGNEIMTRQLSSACGYLAQSSKVLHFGLGDRAKIDKVEITWPSGKKQTLAAPELDKVVAVTEPKE